MIKRFADGFNLIHVIVLSFIILFSAAEYASAQQEIKPLEINSDLFIIPIYGVNTLVLKNGSEALIVDAGYEQVSRNLEQELNKLGIKKVKYLINTHWHFDHVGGNKFFGEGSNVISHSSVRELLSRDETILGEMQKAHPMNVLPDLTTDENMRIYFGEEVQIIPLTGGHTGGDILIYFKDSNVLHIGDIIFSDMFPFVDVDHGGSTITLAENLNVIINQYPDDVIIIPGHGRLLNMDDVKKYRVMVEATNSAIQSCIDKNITMEEMINTEVLKEWESWGKAFSSTDWIEMTYKSMQAGKE